MTIGRVRVETLTGVPTPELLGEVAATLIGPFLAIEPTISEGPTLSERTGIGPLREVLRDRPNISAIGRKHFEALFSWNSITGVRPIRTGSLTVFIDLNNRTRDLLFDSLVTTMRLLQSPFGYLDITESGFWSRHMRHCERYQRGRTGRDRMFTLTSGGISGIAWHTVLGPDLVRFFGEDKLAALPAELARNLGDGLWLLTPCKRFEDWTAGTWCEGEAEIIATLGINCFFDPSTSRLPERTPSLPEFAPYPVRIERSVDDGQSWHWEYHTGYPLSE